MNKKRMQRPADPEMGEGRPKIQGDSLKRAMAYLQKYRTQALLPYLFLVIATLSQLAVPRLTGNVIDAVTEGVVAKTVQPLVNQIPAAVMSQALPKLLDFLQLPVEWTLDQLTTHLQATIDNGPRALVMATLAIVLFASLRGLFSFLQVFWAERNSQSVAFDLRNDLYSKIQKLSFSYYDQNQTGQLMIRATDDVEKVRLFIGQGLIQLVGAIMLIVGTLILLFTTNAALAFVTLPILPIALVIFMLFGTLSRPLFVEVQTRLSKLNTILQENLAGIKVIKAFTREQHEQTKFKHAADDFMGQQIKVARLFTFLFPFVFLIAQLGQAAILYFGGKQILGNTLTIGQWQEFSLYLIFLFMPISQLGFVITQLGQASASASRVFDILDAKSEIVDKPGADPLPQVQGRVVFEDVTFKYYNSGSPVLQKVSFTAEPGMTVALLGATGSGKTTIINLIPRFYDPSSGKIMIDGYDLRDVKLDSIRSQSGIVLQETTLFSGTIRENIAFGKSNASDEEVEAAAKAAAAHDFILTFPKGYETHVGERGVTLSGGQKQRIAIARALLLNPRILILDDSTSSVDLATEAQIQQALDRLMKGRTSFVIAQRISTVRNADLILVLDKGKVVGQGTHTELLESNPIYAEIYSSQLVEDAALDKLEAEGIAA